jgi:cyclic beta-1,2-glucan synthetase
VLSGVGDRDRSQIAMEAVDKLRLTSCLPADWEGFRMHYRYRETVCQIAVVQTPAGNGQMRLRVDGIEQHDKAIPLVDDHQEQWVEVRSPVTGG